MSVTHIPVALRIRVLDSSQHRCGYCHADANVLGAELEIDHIQPEATGGLTVEGNLWAICSACNRKKGAHERALDSLTGVAVRLFNPRTDNWHHHFRWDAYGTRIEPLTAVGRVTATILDLNSIRRVRSREYWIRAGWMPPLTATATDLE